MISLFLTEITSRYPTLSYQELQDYWNHMTCKVIVKHNVCGNPLENELTCNLHRNHHVCHCGSPTMKRKKYCIRHQPTCTILFQSGVKKGKTCGKVCGTDMDTCLPHKGIRMCSIASCKVICEKDKNICSYHDRLEKERERMKFPTIYIRKRGTHYVIKDTNVLYDPQRRLAIGYTPREDVYNFSSHPEVEKACCTYGITFQPPDNELG
jgi:hypothetical protein